MMMKIILIIAVVIVINRPFEPDDFSTGSTTDYFICYVRYDLSHYLCRLLLFSHIYLTVSNCYLRDTFLSL